LLHSRRIFATHERLDSHRCLRLAALPRPISHLRRETTPGTFRREIEARRLDRGPRTGRSGGERGGESSTGHRQPEIRSAANTARKRRFQGASARREIFGSKIRKRRRFAEPDPTRLVFEFDDPTHAL